jgi:hypothetical protein
MPVWFKAAAAQACALLLASALGLAAVRVDLAQPFWRLLAVQSVLAVALTRLFGLPHWWLPIQGLFFPGVVGLLSLHVPSSFYLAGLVALWLVFRSNPKERVPLFLSNQPTWQALASLLAERPGSRFMDLGAGLGGVVAFLAQVRPDGTFVGVESAPLPCLLAWLRLLLLPNATIRWGDLWRESLADYDVVYAFLSPAPMPKLWAKARAEMRPGSLLISNSFEIPGVLPHRVLTLEDGRRTRLLLWIL